MAAATNLSRTIRPLQKTLRGAAQEHVSAVQTAQAHNQIIPTNPSEEFKINVRIQELDQTGIADEAKSLIKKLKSWLKISQYIEPPPHGIAPRGKRSNPP